MTPSSHYQGDRCISSCVTKHQPHTSTNILRSQDHIIMPIYPSLHQYLYLRVNTYIVTPVSYPHTSTYSLTPVPTSSCQHLHPHTSTQLSCQSLDPHTSIIDLRHYLHSCTSTHIIGTILTSLCCYSCIQASTHLVRSSFSSLLASFIACCR